MSILSLDQFNASLLNKCINLIIPKKKKKKKINYNLTDPKLLNGSTMLQKLSISDKYCSFELYIQRMKKKKTVFNTDNNQMFLEHQIIILEYSWRITWLWILSILVMLKIQLCITGINYTLKYIQIEKLFYILIIFHNITAFFVFLII